MKYFFLFLFAFTLTYCLDAQKITGYVYDSTSMEILEFVNIQNTSTYSGTISNEEGYFEISIDSPTTLRFSFLGYNPKEIEVSPNDYAIPLKIYLSSQSLLFDEVVLEAERSNLGKQIVQKVIKNKSNRKLDLSYSCDVYQQTTMIRMYKESEKDSIGPDSFKVQYLNELASTVYVDGNKYKKNKI